MIPMNTLLPALCRGDYDRMLATLYAPDGDAAALTQARNRAIRVTETLAARYAPAAAALFSAPGRTELGGNHTDHQHGRVLCGSVDRDMLSCAAPNGLGRIRICSEGYPEVEIPLDDLAPRPEERGSSAALVRGMAAAFAAAGHPPVGFDACVTSDVLSGSGLSSSAAYETLVGVMLNHFGGCGLDAAAIAQWGQYAENVYFGKPCGLMDQMASSVGGAVAIDFADPAAPRVTPIDYDFSRSGHALCILDTGSCHDDLTDAYAAILQEMGAVAAFFGKQYLREVPEETFRAAVPALRQSCGDRAVLRALHFYTDDRRAAEEAAVLAAGDFPRFLTLVRASGRSSLANLQNIRVDGSPAEQPVALTLALAEDLLNGSGAVRVHGGGFAGTVQAFVPLDRLDSFRAGMESVLGSGRCHVLRIRPQGGCAVIS